MRIPLNKRDLVRYITVMRYKAHKSRRTAFIYCLQFAALTPVMIICPIPGAGPTMALLSAYCFFIAIGIVRSPKTAKKRAINALS